MRVLHFITSLKIGGAEVALCNFLKFCHKDSNYKGQDIKHLVLYIYDGPCRKRIEKLGIKTYQLKGFISPYDFVSFYRLIKFIKKINPDIIHSALWSANILARFCSYFYKIPLICDLHGDCAHHGKVRNFFEKFTLSIPKYFVPVSYSISRSFKKLFDINFEKIVVIQNGIDPDDLCKKAQENKLSRSELGLSKTDFVIGAVGRLHKIKRYDFLIRVFAKFIQESEEGRNIKLCIVGDGPERGSLKVLARELGVFDKILFVGARDDVYRYYPIFDCFVLSSMTEGLSIALLEALSFGLPIVTTHSDKSHDVITDRINGFLVPVSDKEIFVKSMLKIYTNKKLCALMSDANYTLVREKFNISNVAREYRELYKKVLF